MEDFEASVIARELGSGVMAMLALSLILVFLDYVVFYRDGKGRRWLRVRWDPRWYKDITVQAAAALFVLLVGHFMRAFVSWMAFLWIDLGWDPSIWSDAIIWSETYAYFAASTALIIVGKVLILWSFAHYTTRLVVVPSIVTASFAVPAGLWAWANGAPQGLWLWVY